MSSLPLAASEPPAQPASVRGWIARLFEWLFTGPWARIDARDRGASHVGRLTARQATLVTGVVGALMLTTLRYVVMDHVVQSAVADSFVGLCHSVSADWGRAVAPYRQLAINLSWVVGCFVCYFAVPALVIRHVFGLTLTDFYLAPRDYVRQLPKYAILFLPVAVLVLVVARSPEFQQQYPFYQERVGWTDQIVWELGYGVQFFSLEFFFRGFLLRGLAAEMGSMAVMTMMIPYCMIHFQKPLPECLGSIIAGLVLGTIAMDTRSIWGGVTIHVAVAWAMDAAALWQKSPPS